MSLHCPAREPEEGCHAYLIRNVGRHSNAVFLSSLLVLDGLTSANRSSSAYIPRLYNGFLFRRSNRNFQSSFLHSPLPRLPHLLACWFFQPKVSSRISNSSAPQLNRVRPIHHLFFSLIHSKSAQSTTLKCRQLSTATAVRSSTLSTSLTVKANCVATTHVAASISRTYTLF